MNAIPRPASNSSQLTDTPYPFKETTSTPFKFTATSSFIDEIVCWATARNKEIEEAQSFITSQVTALSTQLESIGFTFDILQQHLEDMHTTTQQQVAATQAHIASTVDKIAIADQRLSNIQHTLYLLVSQILNLNLPFLPFFPPANNDLVNTHVITEPPGESPLTTVQQ